MTGDRARVPQARARRESPLGGRRPTRTDLQQVRTDPNAGVDDILPATGERLRLLIVGVNPGLWTAAVNAPFAHPGNRFWPSLFRAGLTGYECDVSAGMRDQDLHELLSRGIGLTNLVARATARADELSTAELREAGGRLVSRVDEYRPQCVAIAGITAFRTAFRQPKATLGEQDAGRIPGWRAHTRLWVVPQPSGLNAHETIDSLAQKWRAVWESLD